MRLTGQQLGELSRILRAAFPAVKSFDQMLLFRLDKNRQNMSIADSYEGVVLDVLVDANAQRWVADLLRAARESNPNDPDLLAFAQQFGLAPKALTRQAGGLAPATLTGDVLEREIRKANSTFDVVRWRKRLGEVETQVCRVEINDGGGTNYGTGFLVSPDVIMTNYHVMERVINNNVAAQDVLLRFDYKKLADGTTINSGNVYRLAAGNDWLIDYSEYSPVDMMVDPQGALPQLDQLDYALLRVDGAPGNEPVGAAKAEPGAPPRNWIKPPSTPYAFESNTALYIMQHPDGEPLKLALDTDAVIGVNNNSTRVRYRTNTEGGSSGSPCFNSDWELIALHHSGDPNFDALHKPEYNQGVPIAAIMMLLQQRGKGVNLGE